MVADAGSSFSCSAHGASLSNPFVLLSDQSRSLNHSHHGSSNSVLRKSGQKSEKSDFSIINSNLLRSLDGMTENDFSQSGIKPISKISDDSKFDSVSRKIIDIIFKATSTPRENNDCNQPNSRSDSFGHRLSKSSYTSEKL